MAMRIRLIVTAALIVLSSALVVISCSSVSANEVATNKNVPLETLTSGEWQAVVASLEKEITDQANHISELSARLYLMEQRMHDLEESQSVLRRENSTLRTDVLRLKQPVSSAGVNNDKGLRWWFIALAVAWGLSQ
jgi:uncharacterized coiled-coil protein SlyX